MKKINIIIFFTIILVVLNCIYLHTYANDTGVTYNTNTNETVYVKNIEELLAQIQISKERKTSDTSMYKIILNRGTYNTDNRISIPSNTCIDLNGNTIEYNYSEGKDVNALKIGPGKDSEPDIVNVEIINGTISGGGLYCNRSQKIKLYNLKFTNCTSHGITARTSSSLDFSYIELKNVSGHGLTFENCSISRLNHITCKDIKKAGISLKTSNGSDLNYLDFYDISENALFVEDSRINNLSHITCKNIKKAGISLKTSTANNIDNCTIQDTASHGIKLYISHVKNIRYNTIVDCGEVGIYLKGPIVKDKNGMPIESEYASGTPIEGNEYGSSAENIEYNTIKNCKGDGIGIYHGSWCKEIIYNELDTIGGNHDGGDGDYGIIVDSMMKAKTYCTRIAHNNIKNVTYCGIAIYSGPAGIGENMYDKKYQDTAYVEKNIENNTLTNCGTYKHSDGWKKERKKGCLSAIYSDTHSLIKGDICNNIIDTTGENGIYIHVFSSVRNIYNNNIKNCKEIGILVYQNSIVRGNIELNKIYNCTSSAISVTQASGVNGKIKSNIIDEAKNDGIYVRESSVGSIIDNKLTNITNTGIYIYINKKNQEDSADIENNTINTCGKNGIAITNGEISGSIKSNDIKNIGENGIYIGDKSKIVSIIKNNLRNIKKNGIYLNKNVIASDIISNNEIYNCSENGIFINGNSIVKGIIKQNAIEKVGKNGIYVGSSSTVKHINNNTLKNIKKVGIYLYNKVTAVDIVSNTITVNNVKDGFGIKVVSKSKMRNIKSNTINGKMIYAIRVLGVYKNGEISSNIISTSNPNNKTFLGIYVEGNKSYKTTISKNKVTGNKTNYGIRLAQGKADIINNTIKKSTFPIYVEKNDAEVKVKGNTISSNTQNLIRTTNQKVNTNNIKLSSVKAKAKTKVVLKYKSSNPITKYEIYQSTSKNGTYKKIQTLNKATYTTGDLKKNKTYYYKVCGYIKDGKTTVYTKDSNIKSIKL